jgi:ribonuclease VapC
MVIDTSAVLAILLAEPEKSAFNALIEADPERLMSAASYFEASILVDRRLRQDGVHHLRMFLHEAEVQVVAVTYEQAEIAREAYRKYGRGNHPAGLNFGDCFAYALAVETDEPLLFKGANFAGTDVRPCA